MGIDKEKEAFEKECKLLCYKGNMVVSNLGNFYNNEQTNWMWQMWLSSKNQAVPDGFVLVPKEPNKQFKNVLSRYLDELWMGEWGCDLDGFVSVNGIDSDQVWEMVISTKAMIEAQEQTND